MTRHRGATLVDLLVITVVLSVLVTLLVPTWVRSRRSQKIVRCADNLKVLWQAATDHHARTGPAWPRAAGTAFWKEVAPPADALACPLRSATPGGPAIHYRGPREDLNRLPPKPGDPMGCDARDNHGPDAGGNVLRFSGDVLNMPRDNGIWIEAEARTSD